MDLHFNQRKFVALFTAAILSLSLNIEQICVAIAEFFHSTVILSPVALSPPDRYIYYYDLVNRSIGDRAYGFAGIYADKALQHWVRPKELCAGNSELSLANDLIELGKFEEAKKFLLNLPPFKSDSPYIENVIAFRQQLRGQAYMGLHQYQLAAHEFDQEIPNLKQDLQGPLKYQAFLALVCCGESERARCVRNQLAELDAYWGPRTHDPVLGFFEYVMLNPTVIDDEELKRKSVAYNSFWQMAMERDEGSAIPLIEAAGQILLNRGLTVESRRLMDSANRIKCDLRSDKNRTASVRWRYRAISLVQRFCRIIHFR